MALFNGISKSNNNIIKQILCSSVQLFHKDTINKYEVDTIDEFTTELLKKKVEKWQNFRVLRMKIDSKLLTTLLNTKTIEHPVEIDVRKCDINVVDELVLRFLEKRHLEKASFVVSQCILHQIYPSTNVLLKYVSVCARIGDCESVNILRDFIKKFDINAYNLHGECRHFVAEALWVRGNIAEALKIFEELYEHHVYLRRNMNLVIKYLSADIVSKQSEAMLVNVIRFAENLLIKLDDCHVLLYIWQICFLSEWYADRCRAEEILDRHPKLIEAIAKRIFPIVKTAVRLHKPEVIHNLLELLLKNNIKTSYETILHTLFDYRYSQNDIRSCAEILRWAAKNKVNLPRIVEQKFISLLTGDKPAVPKRTLPKDFQLKF